MVDEKVMIKDDINFLENPNWVVSERHKLYKLEIEKDKGLYALKSVEGLPNRFDKIVLYYLLYKLLDESQLTNLEIITTRYDIAKHVFFNVKNPGKNEYMRIMLALKKWHCISISFEGVFYEGDNYTIRYFSVIDDVILDKKTKQLYIKFNQQYIKQLQESKFYKYINFHEYKKLTRPISARLYEILSKNFKERPSWHIKIENLAEKLTIEKRSRAKEYYPSDVLASVRPGINEINKNTALQIDFSFDKDTGVCTFKRVKAATEERTYIPALPTVLQLLPQKLQVQESVKKMLDFYLHTKNVEYVTSNIVYALEHAQTNVKTYLKRSLEADWGEEVRAREARKVQQLEVKLKDQQKDTQVLSDRTAKCLELFHSFEPAKQEEIRASIEKDFFMRFIPDENARITAFMISRNMASL